MVELVTRNYWWPGVTRDVGRYVEGCDLCQKMKNRMEELAGKLKLSEILEKLWTHLTMDLITKLPVVAGKDAILVVCDRLSKMAHFVATMEGTSVEGLARLFWNNIWKLHRLLEYCVGSRTSVHSRFDKRVEQNVRDKDEVVNSIPPTNGWANKIY